MLHIVNNPAFTLEAVGRQLRGRARGRGARVRGGWLGGTWGRGSVFFEHRRFFSISFLSFFFTFAFHDATSPENVFLLSQTRSWINFDKIGIAGKQGARPVECIWSYFVMTPGPRASECFRDDPYQPAVGAAELQPGHMLQGPGTFHPRAPIETSKLNGRSKWT